MPYVTNPYLISRRSAAVTLQIIKTMKQTGNKYCSNSSNTGAATTTHLFTLSGLQTAEGRGAPSPECLGTQNPPTVSVFLRSEVYAYPPL